MDAELTEEQRYPLIGDAGRQLLRRLLEHPHAPRYNFRAGDRLTRAGLDRVREFKRTLATGPRRFAPGVLPPWLPPFAGRCLEDVPIYRRGGGAPDDFVSLPTVGREDLSREPWSFVPDAAPLDDLIVYPTSGTTGHPVSVLSHPEVVASYIPLMRRALATRNVMLEGGPGRVSIVIVCFQRKTFTFPAISSYLGEAGQVKINLYPGDWRDPDDRVRFLDSVNPEIYSGDPISLEALARLPLTTRPKALLSTSMMLLAGYRERLERHFGRPVFDLYSLNEAGPIAVSTAHGHEILPHDMYVEILHPDDTPCEPGERGEVTLTGGRNPFLPLLRYRTGDYASLDVQGDVPVFIGLEGRPATIFRSTAGEPINNIDVTWALEDLALPQFTLHQSAQGALRLRVRGKEVLREGIREAILDLFGPNQDLAIEEMTGAEALGGKVVQYSSDLPHQE
jgi:phenylacetate-CoA ligase